MGYKMLNLGPTGVGKGSLGIGKWNDENIREEAKKYLPEYMIPKKIIFKETLPVTNNGKTDRKALAAMLEKH